MAFPRNDASMAMSMNASLEAAANTKRLEQPRSPKTKRPDKERVRVSRACDRCKRKKIRCSGKKPCLLCNKLGITCEFNARYTRGRLPQVEEEASNLSSADNEQTGMIEQEDEHSFQEPATPISNDLQGSLLVQEPESAVHSSRNSPEPSQTDRQGHYVGPSSAVSFLLRAQKRLHNIVSLSPNSSIFTFGDSSLPEFDSSFFILPPIEKARALVARYFDFAVPTHRYLHRGTIEGWVEDLYANPGDLKHGDRGKRAVTFMVFAQASEYIPKDNGTPDSKTSARYFQAAEHQLRSETGEIRLTSIQARLLQCFWLLSESRINHCWSLFGTTAHLLLALGLHRKRRRDHSSNYDPIDAECRKRVFWSAYTLDIYLSAALGRPRTFHDDDIDQELPSLFEDSQLSSDTPVQNNKAQSVMLGPVFHARLAQIISKILKDLYGIRPVRLEMRAALAKKHTDELRRWRQGISHFLDIDSSLLSPLFQRQSNVLRLAYAHALILVHRPFLLSNFADLTRPNYTSRANRRSLNHESIQECLKAAMSIVNIVNDLCDRGQNYPTFWFTHYYSFCAVVILYIYTIQSRSESPEIWRPYFEAAERCQNQISSLKAVKDSFAQRFSIVLEELRLEALKQTTIPKPSASHDGGRNEERDQDTEVAHTILRLSENNQLENCNFSSENASILQASSTPTAMQQLTVDSNLQPGLPASESFEFSPSMIGASPASMAGEAMTGWGEFDSFVTAGIGGLESHFFEGLQDMNNAENWDFSASLDPSLNIGSGTIGTGT